MHRPDFIISRTLVLISGILLLLCAPVFSGQATDELMWVQLGIASDSAQFRINLPENGCVSIISTVPGRRSTDRIWGPRFMKKGTYSLTLPAGRILNRQGTVELFNLKIAPITEMGTRGSGERQFSNPMGLDIDPVRKELLIADTGNDRVVRLSADGRFIAQHGGFGISFGDSSEKREDSLDDPYDVAAGGFSNFYVSDQNNHRIATFDSYKSYKGNLYPRTGNRRDIPERPRGIKVDSENSIWLVDGRSDSVLKISSNGEKLFEIGGFGYSTFQLKDPTQVDVNQRGEIFIADRGNARIAIFDRLGSFIHELTDNLQSPAGVAVDPDGLILVVDDRTNLLSIYTPSGDLITTFANASDGSSFRRPSDLATNKEFIYLLDSGNHRVVFFSRHKISKAVSWQASSPVVE